MYGEGRRGLKDLTVYCYFADILLFFADERGGGIKNPENVADAIDG